MDIVTSLSKKELEQIIFDQVAKCLNDKLSPAQPEQSDRCGLNEACVILGTPDKPASKAKVYQLTHLKKIAFRHYGRSLEFSRRSLIAYREANTLSPSPEDEVKDNITKSAQKHLRNASK